MNITGLNAIGCRELLQNFLHRHERQAGEFFIRGIMPNREMQSTFKELGMRGVFVKSAMSAFTEEDKGAWKSGLFASRVVGNYERGATLGLADDAGKSTDTIEDRAHAYMMFEKLCKLDGGKFRLFVFSARRSPYIYISHFRALHDIQTSYKLSDGDVLSLLMDIVQAEGSLSSRKMDAAARLKFGDTRDWTFYAQQAIKKLSVLLDQPDLPLDTRKKAEDLFSDLGDNA